MKGIHAGLKTILIFSFVLLIGLSGAVTGLISYNYSYSIIFENAKEKLIGQTTTQAEELDMLLKNAETQIEVLSVNEYAKGIQAGTENGRHLLSLFEGMKASAGDFDAVYMGTKDKRFYIKPDMDIPEGYDPTSRPWYQDAEKANGRIVWTEPYKDATSGSTTVTVAKAILVNGEVIGVIGADVNLKQFTQKIREAKTGQTGYMYLASAKGIALVHPDEKVIGTDLSQVADLKKVFGTKSGFYSYKFGNPPADNIQAFDTSALSGWKLGAVISKKELLSQVNMLRTAIMAVAAVVVLLSAAFSVWFASTVAKPVGNLAAHLEKASRGELEPLKEQQKIKELILLNESYNTMIDTVGSIIENIRTASDQVAAGAKQVSDSSTALSQGAAEQASSIQQVTASIEQISAQTKQNARFAVEANYLADAAKTDALAGNDSMKQMLKAMDDINLASGNISRIIKVIDEIAFQTNILALNAAVEAARAGRHGKGFAVVAEEVRNLAARSANAAKETTAMIEGSIRKVESGTITANQTAEALNRIVDGISKVAVLVKDIASASNEQALGIAQVNQAILQVSNVVQSNSATSEESAAASDELANQADMLKEQISVFKIKSRNAFAEARTTKESVHPSVLKMLDNMHLNKEKKTGAEHQTLESGAVRISLSDRDFGKY